MKCLACGADVSASVKFCDYCGSAVAATAGGAARHAAVAPVPGTIRAEAAAAEQSVWPQPGDLVFRLWSEPAAHPIRWLAFFFPLAWLAGYGALRAAIGLALVFVAGELASRLLGLAYAPAAAFMFTALVFFYSYKVAVNADRLVPVRGKFNWLAAIGFMFAYVLLIVLLH